MECGGVGGVCHLREGGVGQDHGTLKTSFYWGKLFKTGGENGRQGGVVGYIAGRGVDGGAEGLEMGNEGFCGWIGGGSEAVAGQEEEVSCSVVDQEACYRFP